MKDSIALILTAIGMAGLAWCFWYFLGNNRFEVIATIALIVLTVDNVRLRRKLRSNRVAS